MSRSYLKKKAFVSLLVIFCLAFLFSITELGNSEDVELKPHASFYLHFYQPDFGNYTVNAEMSCFITSIKLNQTSILVQVENGYESGQEHFGWNILHVLNVKQKDNQILNGVGYFNYQHEGTCDFSLFGASELYPFDSYYLNLTFFFQDYEEIKNDSEVIVNPRMLFGHQTGWDVENYGNTTISRSPESPNIIHVNQQMLFKRVQWSTFPISLILLFGFAVLGSVVLIEPGDIRSRSAIYLSIFVFFSTFYFTVLTNIPKQYSLSIGENMVLLLISGTALFLIFSIIQYKMSQYSNSSRSRIFDQLMMLVPILVISIFIHNLFDSARAFAASYYFWTNIPSNLPYVFLLTIFWVGGMLELVIPFFYRKRKRDRACDSYIA